MRSIAFTKCHGLGNDYLFIDRFEQPEALHGLDLAALAPAMCNRREGVGADGVITLGPDEAAHARMSIVNSDGSDAAMCGNGIRCAVKLLIERGRAPEAGDVVIATPAGPRTGRAELRDGRVQRVAVDMGAARSAWADAPIDWAALGAPCPEGSRPVTMFGQRCSFVDVGNPHLVVHLDAPELVETFDLERFVHAHITQRPAFPSGINTHVVAPIDRSRLLMRSWERGAGPTRACGTGACAVTAACALDDRASHDVTVSLPGGDLSIDWSADTGHVRMTGPCVEVFSGSWLLD